MSCSFFFFTLCLPLYVRYSVSASIDFDSFSLFSSCLVSQRLNLLVAQDINLRLSTLPPPRSLSSYPFHLQNPLPLPQLTALLTLLNQALDIIDISRWTGDPHNGAFISGQLRLLSDTIEEAQQTLKGGEDVAGGKWWEDSMPEDVCHLAFLTLHFIHRVHPFHSTIATSCRLGLYLLTISLYQDIFTSPPPKLISSSLHRRRGPSAARPHTCSSVRTRIVSDRSFPSYSAGPGSSTACS